MAEKAYVELIDINKSFGQVHANKNVCLKVNKGEILSLLGENGSGKSTLVNMLSGIYTPDSGKILINGEEKHFTSPNDAISSKVGMVHQHFKLIDVFTAFENITLGEKKTFFATNPKSRAKIEHICEKYGLNISLDKKIYDMSVGEKQTVEIVKVLFRGAEVLILDEPTAVLTPQETSSLFNILRKMKSQGASIIIITHKLNEVMEISDKVTVLRNGESIGTVNTSETTPQQLTEMMVGSSVTLEIKREAPVLSEKPALVVKNLIKTNSDKINVINDMSFELFSGEIMGVAGIAGSGQKELCEIIAGLDTATSGDVQFKGESILGMSPRTIIKKGISMSFVPEDRLGMGLVAGMDITDNVLLKSYAKNKGPFIDRKSGRALAKSIVKKFNVSTPSINHTVKKLSGGNIQKVLLGREIDLNPNLLITAYPVRGLDIGASYNIYDVLNEQKAKGVAILYIGEDLDVLLELCDRVMVIHDGKIMDIVDPHKTTKEEIGLLMLAHKNKEESENV